ncbi:MAG: hypothetical protein ACRC7S_04005 [Cetobacterium sp.]
MLCLFGFHKFEKWRIVKDRTFMGEIKLFRVRRCIRCSKIEREDIVPFGRYYHHDVGNIPWWFDDECFNIINKDGGR